MARRLAPHEKAPAPGGLAWRTRDDAIAAVRALNNAPLPRIDASGALAVRKAFKAAYAKHPVIIAAQEWSAAEIRDENTFTVAHHITSVSVHAMRRWLLAHPETTPTDDPDDPDDDAPF